MKLKENVREWYSYAFSSIYLASSFEQVYENNGIVPPIIADLVPEKEDEVAWQPPLRYKTPGRPTKKRKQKRTENSTGGPAKVHRCSICGSTEHNARGCSQSKAILNLPLTQPIATPLLTQPESTNQEEEAQL